MTNLAFIDTETTSLRPDRRVWEVAVILRTPVTVKHPDGPDTQGTADQHHHWFVRAEDLDLGNADLMSLKIGRFHERHPQMNRRSDPSRARAEADVLREVEDITRGAHLVGAVVNFDAEVLGARMRAHGICPSWHYHLIDIEALAVGWLNRKAGDMEDREATPNVAAALRTIARPPWKSDELAAALGVTISEEDRHTALGDALWARDMYDAVMGSPS